ncbi:hypothetical protein QBC46DRAFT_5072 [Diplogelasinospora grovesii]|uniref:KOW domain-containing protein n=1 Tax=Diplogelasinospora grovesii TaxID=303347 RepID=A0AAN6NJR1_9PEZI|nr:hypothetical protein QBC46DRAFT_5072 [Diplogelasinospora grovesii]
MDKLLRRVRMAEGQVGRRNKKRSLIKHIVHKNDRKRAMKGLRAEAGSQLKQAIVARHEDWELGPLAPRRDVSKVDEFGNYWGSISAQHAMLEAPLKPEEKEARAAWCGGSQYLCLAPGDRVVVLEGAYKGKIGVIETIKKDIMALELVNDLRVNAVLPEFMVTDGVSPVNVMSSVIPISSVRLVHPLPDPKTGKVRDVIIRELKPVRITHDRPTRKVHFSRLVPGLNAKIPWPKNAPKVHEDHDADTLRIDVEERTFVPTLLRPPMPEAVIDELRNRYSIFRTRHTPEYIAQKEAEEAEKKALKAKNAGLLTPIQEFNRQQRALRRERGQPVLTEEMLQKIGEVIAKNKQRQQAAAGLNADVNEVVSRVEKIQLNETPSIPKDGESQPPPL